MAKWQKKPHLVDKEVRLGAHSLPPGHHVLEGDYWAQFTDVLDRVPEVATAPKAAPSMPAAPTPSPVAPTLPPAAPTAPTLAPTAPSAPAASATEEAAGGDHADGDDKHKKKGKGR